MSETFDGLAAAVIEQGPLSQRPRLATQLLKATSKMLELVESSSEGLDVAPGKSRLSTIQDQISNLADETLESQIAIKGQGNTVSPPTRHSIIPLSVTGDFYSNSIFGNGWFDQSPAFVTQNGPTMSSASDDKSFSFQLVERTLIMCYDALLDLANSPVELRDFASMAFQWSFLYHTRDELLFNVRWFLGPGIRSLHILARAIFMNDAAGTSDTKFPRAFGPSQILHPMVDNAAFQQSQSNGALPEYLNASEVEDYLKSLSNLDINQTVLQLSLPNSNKVGKHRETNYMSFNNGDLGAFQYTNTSGTSAHAPMSDLSYSFGNQSQVRESVTNIRDLFSFNALLESGQEREKGFRSQEPRQTREIISVNRTLLLQNLTKNSFCLGNGPGYTIDGVHNAILESVVGEI